jgi:hypothetical protein
MRQRGLEDERLATVRAATQEFAPEKQTEERDTISRNLEQYLSPANERTAAEAEFADRANPGAPKEINESRERALSAAVSKGADYAKNLARMSALKNVNFGNALSINRLGTNIGELNTQAGRSASLLPYELEAANAAGNAGMTRASAAQGLASIAAMYGASQLGKTVATPTPTPVPQPGGTGLTIGGGVGLKPPGSTLSWSPNIFAAGDPYALNLRL